MRCGGRAGGLGGSGAVPGPPGALEAFPGTILVALGWLLGRPKWSLGGFWVALVASLGGPGVAAPPRAPGSAPL